MSHSAEVAAGDSHDRVSKLRFAVCPDRFSLFPSPFAAVGTCGIPPTTRNRFGMDVWAAERAPLRSAVESLGSYHRRCAEASYPVSWWSATTPHPKAQATTFPCRDRRHRPDTDRFRATATSECRTALRHHNLGCCPVSTTTARSDTSDPDARSDSPPASVRQGKSDSACRLQSCSIESSSALYLRGFYQW